jgi:hypothetical protein
MTGAKPACLHKAIKRATSDWRVISQYLADVLMGDSEKAPPSADQP